MEKFIKSVNVRGRVQIIIEAENEEEAAILWDKRFKEVKLKCINDIPGVHIEYHEGDTLDFKKESDRLRNFR